MPGTCRLDGRHQCVPAFFVPVQPALGGGACYDPGACHDGGAESRRIPEKNVAENLLEACRKEMVATIQRITRKEKSENPPPLYNLTTLQRDANRLLGYSAQQTLDYVQSLYEKKLTAYPRTDSCYITDDGEEMLENLAEELKDFVGVAVGDADMDRSISQLI